MSIHSMTFYPRHGEDERGTVRMVPNTVMVADGNMQRKALVTRYVVLNKNMNFGRRLVYSIKSKNKVKIRFWRGLQYHYQEHWISGYKQCKLIRNVKLNSDVIGPF